MQDGGHIGGVARRSCDRTERLHQRHAGGERRAERARETGDGGAGEHRPGDRHAEAHPVHDPTERRGSLGKEHPGRHGSRDARSPRPPPRLRRLRRARFADWARRPLPDRQIDYALADVTWLRAVYEGLMAELRRNDRADWVVEEEAVLLDPETYRLDPDRAWKRLKTRSTDPAYLAVVRAVAAWREREAQRLDLPRNRVLRDDALLDVAAQAPGDAGALAQCRGVTQGMAAGRLGPGLLAAVAEGRAVAPDDRPQPAPQRERPRGVGPAMELLRVLLKARVEHEGVAQKLVASTEDLEDLAGGAEDGPLLRGWRKELFGADAQRLLRGELALTVKRGRVVVSEIV